jgi:hypothetical protein
MRNEPTDRQLRPLGDCTFKKVRYKDQWKIEVQWRDPTKSRDRRKQRCKHWVDNPRAAREYADKVNAKLEASRGGATPFTFADAADRYLSWLEKRTRAKEPDFSLQSLAAVRPNVEKARIKFDRRLLHEIQSQEIADWLLEQSADLKHSTLVHRKRAIGQVLNSPMTGKCSTLTRSS